MIPDYRTCTEHGEVEVGSKIVNGELIDTCPVCEQIALGTPLCTVSHDGSEQREAAN